MATRSIVPRANDEGGVGSSAKKWANIWATLVNALTLTAQATGFTIAGGTTSKTLTVDETATLSAKANLASPTFTGTVNVSGATLTLADNQISGDKVEGGTINAVTVNTLTSTTVNSTTLDTNVAAAGVTLSGTTLSADGTDANIDINITPKGTGEVNLTKVDIDNGTIDGTDITVGSGKTLNVSAGTLTLAADQISGDSVEGGTINAVTVNTLTSTTVNATTVDTNVAAAGVTLAGVTLSADGTDANININITPKGTGEVNLTKVDIDAGTIDGATIATSNITVGSGKTLDVSAGTLTLADNQIPGAKVAAATAITEGVVELATNAEVLTGTDTTRAVTPAGLGYAIGRDIVYGVMWNTAASSPTLTKGLVIGGNWIAETFTSYPIQLSCFRG